MQNQSSAIVLGVCQCDQVQVDHTIVGSLRDHGFQVHLVDANDLKENSKTLLDYDCLLVDWRDADAAIAAFFAELACREPVVAIIDSKHQQTHSELLNGFVDFVCTEEFALESFKLRLRRTINRYKNPLDLCSTNTPEARLLQTVVNHSNDWLFIKDLDHRFLAVSEDYAASLELSLDNVIGKNDLDVGFSADIVYGSDKVDWDGFWPQDDNAVKSGEPTVETNPNRRVFTGDTRHRRTVRVPLKNRWDEVYALLICSEDITAIVKSEQVLKERNEMLENVIQEKLRADHSRLMAELAVTAKNKFIATASHDLRQPLHALGLYLDVLESKLKQNDQRTLVQKIKNSSQALSVLFNSLLDLSRLDAGVVDVEATHFQLGPLLKGLNEEFSEIAGDQSVQIDIEQSKAVLYTDALLLERILRNLIQNAITYTEKGSVQLRIEKENKNDTLLIHIQDTGPGIPQYEQNAIFSEYYQLEHQGRKPTIGLGLGLSIVKRLVELMDVKFDLHSVPGKGSTFSLELALGDVTLVQEPKAMADGGQLVGQSILVIDDEDEILDGMVQVLSKHGCVPISALSAADAIEKLTTRDIVPVAIVADYRLHNGHTGVIAIELVREEFNKDIPAIIITGDTSPDRLKEATKSGFRLLHKPLQPAELIDELSGIIGSGDATGR